MQNRWQCFNFVRGESESRSVMSNSLGPHGLYSPWNSPGQNTGMGSLSLLHGIFPPRDWTQVSHIAGRFFTSWATREVLILEESKLWFREVKKQIRGYWATKSAEPIFEFQVFYFISKDFPVNPDLVSRHISHSTPTPRYSSSKITLHFSSVFPSEAAAVSVWREDICTFLHYLPEKAMAPHSSTFA